MSNNKRKAARGNRSKARTVGSVVKSIFKVLGTLILLFATTGVIFACIFAIYVKTSLSTELDLNLQDFSLDQTSTIYYSVTDENNEVQYVKLASLYSDVNSSWVKYEEIPKHLEHAAVAIEDKRFYDHHGVDWFRTFGAFGNMFLEMKNTFGGSTLTQQLIKNLTEYDDVTVKRKLLEIFRALEFEKNYTKQDIVEWYLNTSYLGEGCNGVGSASYVYFGKNVSELSLAECAALIGITNNPSMYDPYINKEANKKRQLLILGEMLDQDFITQAEYDQAVNEELVFQRGETNEETTLQSNSWFVDAIIEDVINDLRVEKNVSYKVAERLLYTAGYQIYATIDPEIQTIVDEIYTNRDELPSGYAKSSTQELQSAILIMNPKTGDIVAMAGGLGQKEGSRIYNRATQALRPPGSTIKPIASYAPAIDLGYIMPYTTFNDSAFVKLKGTEWFPNNDDSSNSGLITIRYAVQRSINTVAAQVMDMLTPQVSYDFLVNKLGVSSLLEAEDGMSDIDYAPLALGQLTHGISVRELTEAYSIFPNNGVFTEGRTYTKVLDATGNVVLDNKPETIVAISDVTAYYMNDLLQNVVNAGTGYYARLPNMTAAGKTGASDNWRDRWFVGYTPYYVGAVWCGYDIPEYMGSSNPSAVLWQKVMSRVHENLENKEFSRPDNMRQVTVCIDTGLLATDICANDLRGNHTMTLYMEESKIPKSSCTAHVWQEVCKDSYGLMTDTCPRENAMKAGMLDPGKFPWNILTPPYYKENKFYSTITGSEVPDPIEYVISELKPCGLHNIDPITGWYIDPDTGFLVKPNNRNILYDTVNDKFYDRLSGFEIDPRTGMLVDPESGKLINPWTGNEYTETPDPFAPDAVDRPPTYGPSEPPVIEPPPVTPTEPTEPTDPGGPEEPYNPDENPPVTSIPVGDFW